VETKLEILNFFKSLDSKCFRVSSKFFPRGSSITTYIEKRNQMCILLEGSAELIRYDFNGNKTIIGQFTSGDIFGEAFYPAKTNNELFVMAKEDSKVLIFLYNNINYKCKQNCKVHNEFMQKLQLLIINNVVNLNTKIELLSKKNIRDKLLSYFDLLASQKLSKSFILPLSLTDLADYLSIDRSAMMRELSHLKDEGFIEKNGRKIKLLYE